MRSPEIAVDIEEAARDRAGVSPTLAREIAVVPMSPVHALEIQAPRSIDDPHSFSTVEHAQPRRSRTRPSPRGQLELTQPDAGVDLRDAQIAA